MPSELWLPRITALSTLNLITYVVGVSTINDHEFLNL